MKNVKPLATTMLFGLLLTGCVKELEENSSSNNQLSIPPQANPIAENARENHVPNEVLVKFKRGISEVGRTNALARINGSVKEKISSPAIASLSDEAVYVIH
ncbi:MAG TPA: hypothetical protein VM888_00900, partial [Chitinophagaceae bacterium]|nr:hypothetical protein [Chitinophagaceae bacterium]